MAFDSFWRQRLLPASFRAAPFHIEVGGQTSGRRAVMIEYPKRNVAKTEDMGRVGRRFQIAAYVVGSDYIVWRELLMTMLEMDGPGLLILPTYGTFWVNAGLYTVTEVRERGGFAAFDLVFLESGEEFAGIELDTQSAIDSAASAVEDTAMQALNSIFS